jgi:hypothetical protein
MGIPKFYNSIVKSMNYINIEKTDVIFENVTRVYLDFKSMIYNAAEKIAFEENIALLGKIFKTENLNPDEIIKGKLKREAEIQEKIIGEIIDKLEDILNKSNINYLFISNDGIPELSKCIEQKQRKTMDSIGNQIKNKIKRENKPNIYQNDLHRLFEKNKCEYFKIMSSIYVRDKILFLDKVICEVIKILGKSSYKFEQIKDKQIDFVYNNTIREVEIVVDNLNYGEGEAKFLYDIIKKKSILTNNDKILIYSPDADLILLSCLVSYKLSLNNYFPSIFVYNDKQSDNINTNGTIKITDFSNNEDSLVGKIGKKVIKGIAEEKKEEINRFNNEQKLKIYIKITKDLVYLFTFFGNDFLPKIESMNETQNAINNLVSSYSFAFNRRANESYNFRYLVNLHEGQNHLINGHVINYDFMMDVLNNFIINERELYNAYHIYEYTEENKQNYLKKYISKEYYLYLFANLYNSKRIHIIEIIISEINDLIIKNNPAYESIEQFINKIKGGNISFNLEDNKRNIIITLIDEFFKEHSRYDNSSDLLFKLKNIISGVPDAKKFTRQFFKSLDKRFDTAYQLTDKIENDDMYNIKKKLENNRLIDNKYNFAVNAIINKFTNYDKEIIKFENMKEEWATKLNIVSIPYDNINTIPEYYPTDDEVYHYLEGMGFVFNWYFDRMMNTDYDKDNDKDIQISTWFYRKNKKIFTIRRIVEYINTHKSNIMEIKIPFIYKTHYFNNDQHQEYIKPADIALTDNMTGIIDCKYAQYFNKCYVNYEDKQWNNIDFVNKEEIRKDKNIEIIIFSDEEMMGGNYNKYIKYFNKNKK